MPKILILHFRVGRTDGVSLEIASWKEIFERKGFKVLLAGGHESIGSDFLVSGLENQMDSDGFRLDEEAFGGFKRLDESSFKREYEKRRLLITAEFDRVFNKAKPDYVIISNIFSVGENLPAAEALFSLVARSKIPTVFIGHDYYWENPRYKKPSSSFVESVLASFFPPKLPNIKYLCINSLVKKELKMRKGIDAKVVYDTLDFKKPAVGVSDKCRNAIKKEGIKNGDLVILQATRIVRRKNIEIAMDFVYEFNRKITKAKLYDGRIFDPCENKITFVMAGYAERRDEKYLDLLLARARNLGINLVRIDGIVRGNQSGEKGVRCSLFEIYSIADLITYPSGREGFGNQFLEAVYNKKPIAVFEYPVFRSDIAPLGFKVVSFGDRLAKGGDGLVKIGKKKMEQAVDDSIKILTNAGLYQKIVSKNYKIAADNFSYENAWKVFSHLLSRSYSSLKTKWQI